MLVLRELTDADVDPVAALHVRAWQAGYAGIVPADVLDALDPADFAQRRRALPAPPGARTLVAEDDGVIVGFVSFGPYLVNDTPEFDAAIGQVYAIYVEPGRWRGGAGRELITAARAGLTAAGARELRLWVLADNQRARRFYEHAGLSYDGTDDFFTPQGSTTPLAEVRYAAPLAG
ncbi:RimJ/RimL family protein N-acetyltransferase [Krasilnikovia cinnamomea]|uniref:RimJ/RimL family protein N-acetyltransferase n=1 Tax=Krasilnikovia cinnamomea TaxID=349313 RepID=A0A4Q7ZHJ0_9ACTN|nr:GNAT family N-acetyltransferase [Krasilnikovia cinnamomea]RZU49683.1 RimJ/RimL family protein N-acetyltransferase [Krasilnikovia cinnamomea]